MLKVQIFALIFWLCRETNRNKDKQTMKVSKLIGKNEKNIFSSKINQEMGQRD